MQKTSFFKIPVSKLKIALIDAKKESIKRTPGPKRRPKSKQSSLKGSFFK